jgi:hypothetical protein
LPLKRSLGDHVGRLAADLFTAREQRGANLADRVFAGDAVEADGDCAVACYARH